MRDFPWVRDDAAAHVGWAMRLGAALVRDSSPAPISEGPTPSPPRLLDRVRGALRAAHYSRRTEEAYVGRVRRFGAFGTNDLVEPRQLDLEHDLWPWQGVFPATRTYVARDGGERRRHHLHETVVQRAVRQAALGARLSKRVTCHTFRHSFATHLIEGGYAPCRSCWATATSAPR